MEMKPGWQWDVVLPSPAQCLAHRASCSHPELGFLQLCISKHNYVCGKRVEVVVEAAWDERVGSDSPSAPVFTAASPSLVPKIPP